MTEGEGRTRDLVGLLRLMAQSGEDESLSQSLSVVARMAALVTRAPRAGVFLEDPESGVLRLVASHGLETDDSSRVTAIAVEKQPWAQNQKSLFIPRAQPRVPGPDAIPPPFDQDSLWVALYSAGQPVGRLVIQGNGRVAPDETTEEFLRLVAIYAGSIVSKARLYGALQRRVEELTVLYEVGRSLSSTLDLDRVLGLMVDGVVRLTGCQACSIMLLENGVLRIRKARGIPEDVVQKAVRRLGDGISGRVAQTGEPLFIRDVNREKGLDASHAARYRSPSLICVPLKARGRVIGVLNANDKRSGDFTPEDFNLVTLFANQAALAIDNASLHEQLWKTSVTDGLTQTYVRAYFKQQLDRLVAAALATGGFLGLIMVDLDHFKAVNDRYGHQAGDEVLKQVSTLLRRAVRAEDVVARYGGEEFVLVLSNCTPQVVVTVAERIRRTVEASRIRLPPPSRPGVPAAQAQSPRPMSDVPVAPTLTVTASFGVAVLPIDASDGESLIRVADEYLYASKRAGRNRVSCSDQCRQAALAAASAR